MVMMWHLESSGYLLSNEKRNRLEQIVLKTSEILKEYYEIFFNFTLEQIIVLNKYST